MSLTKDYKMSSTVVTNSSNSHTSPLENTNTPDSTVVLGAPALVSAVNTIIEPNCATDVPIVAPLSPKTLHKDNTNDSTPKKSKNIPNEHHCIDTPQPGYDVTEIDQLQTVLVDTKILAKNVPPSPKQ